MHNLTSVHTPSIESTAATAGTEALQNVCSIGKVCSSLLGEGTHSARTEASMTGEGGSTEDEWVGLGISMSGSECGCHVGSHRWPQVTVCLCWGEGKGNEDCQLFGFWRSLSTTPALLGHTPRLINKSPSPMPQIFFKLLLLHCYLHRLFVMLSH